MREKGGRPAGDLACALSRGAEKLYGKTAGAGKAINDVWRYLSKPSRRVICHE